MTRSPVKNGVSLKGSDHEFVIRAFFVSMRVELWINEEAEFRGCSVF